jgi:thioredoxin reductase
MVSDMLTNHYDVIVIGGGAAGLSGALQLARSRRSVRVLDAGEPRNAPAAGVHGFFSREGVPPAELLEAGRAEVRSYGGEVLLKACASSASRDVSGFAVTLDDGRTLRARRLLVTTGLVDELPDVRGLRERWGREVVHCPYCHGWELRDRPIGVLATGPRAMHQVQLFRQLTDDLVLFTHTTPGPNDEEAEQLLARDVRVITGRVESLEIADDRLTGVRLADGSFVAREALVVMPWMAARSAVLASLGLRPAAHASGAGESIVAIDASGRTEVPGVWVAGNVTDLTATVVVAAAGGATAGAAINADLAAEDTQQAVAALRRAVVAA